MTAQNIMSPNGRLYARFGRASASPNLAERSERMRAERSPTSPKFPSEECVQAGYVHVRIVFINLMHAERPEGEAWPRKSLSP
jgi:hypothetical protein